MSTLLPSLSERPLVTSGTAVMPPVPVVVVAPAPSRRNHASIVNVAAPRPGAGPIVTYAFVPPKSIALLTGAAAVTVTLKLSLLARSPSLAVSISTYVPDAEKLAVVTVSFGCANVTVPGPLTLLQVVIGSPPGWPSSVTTPTSDAVTDGATTSSEPAFTAGA